MTTNNHPITPPPGLVDQWYYNLTLDSDLTVATQAARWGADQELEACCEWVSIQLNCTDQEHLVPHLRAARRPKPPSLKELALARLTSLEELAESMGHSPDDTIRRALEALDD